MFQIHSMIVDGLARNSMLSLLPAEILEQIFINLEPKDRDRLAECSRKLYHLSIQFSRGPNLSCLGEILDDELLEMLIHDKFGALGTMYGTVRLHSLGISQWYITS